MWQEFYRCGINLFPPCELFFPEISLDFRSFSCLHCLYLLRTVLSSLFSCCVFPNLIIDTSAIQEPPPPPPPEKPWSEVESSVIHLTDENFKPFLKKKKHVLVMFYAPCEQACFCLFMFFFFFVYILSSSFFIRDALPVFFIVYFHNIYVYLYLSLLISLYACIYLYIYIFLLGQFDSRFSIYL